MHGYTEVDEGIWVCNDCGAHADTTKNIKHHGTCHPGESDKRERFYNDANEEEEVNAFAEWCRKRR